MNSRVMIHVMNDLSMFIRSLEGVYQVENIGTIREKSYRKKVERVGDLATLAH